MFTTATVKGDMIDTSGLKAWETCALCHGVDGDSHMAKFPKLAGQPFAYLAKQLRDFKNKRRRNDGGMMTAMAASKSIRELLAAARYFSKLPAPPVSESKLTASETARALFENGDVKREIPACRTCHGTAARFPWLQAQHADYLQKQLGDFRKGSRRNDAGGAMRKIAQRLTAHEVAALAQYLAGQPRPAGAVR